MKPARWTVMLSPGPDDGGPAIVVEVTRTGEVRLFRHPESIRKLTLTPLTACQLGQALQDASRYAASGGRR